MNAAATQVHRFELSVRLVDGSEWRYDYLDEGPRVVAHLRVRGGDGSECAQTDPASLEVTRRLLRDVAPSPDMSRAELARRSCAALQVGEDAIERLAVDVEFTDGTAILGEAGA